MKTYKSKNGVEVSLPMNDTQETFKPHKIKRYSADFMSDVLECLKIDSMTDDEMDLFLFDSINARVENKLNYKDYNFSGQMRLTDRNRSTNIKAIQRYKELELEKAQETPQAKTDTTINISVADVLAYCNKYKPNGTANLYTMLCSGLNKSGEKVDFSEQEKTHILKVAEKHYFKIVIPQATTESKLSSLL